MKRTREEKMIKFFEQKEKALGTASEVIGAIGLFISLIRSIMYQKIDIFALLSMALLAFGIVLRAAKPILTEIAQTLDEADQANDKDAKLQQKKALRYFSVTSAVYLVAYAGACLAGEIIYRITGSGAVIFLFLIVICFPSIYSIIVLSLVNATSGAIALYGKSQESIAVIPNAFLFVIQIIYVASGEISIWEGIPALGFLMLLMWIPIKVSEKVCDVLVNKK